jgi:flagellar hook-associated protein 2
MPTISSALNAGSGIDTAGLVSQLVAAERGPRATTVAARRTSNEARLTALSQVRAGVSAFSTALNGLIAGGTTTVRPVSSDASKASMTLATPSAKPMIAILDIQHRATSQIIAFNPLAKSTDAVGEGTLQLRFGTMTDSTAGGVNAFTADPARPPVTIAITPANNTLDGLVRSINAAGSSITASLLSDNTGTRLVLKGAEGKQSAFSVESLPTVAASPLAGMTFGFGTAGAQLTQSATDAAFKLDGVALTAPQNHLKGLIEGYEIDLKKADPGQPVILQSDYNQDDLKNAVSNFVGAYNELNSLLADLTRSQNGNTAAGPLQGDATVRDVRRQLSALTTTRTSASTTVSSLSNIGVRINRDGTLSVATDKLNAVAATSPADINNLFTGNRTSSSAAIAVSATSTAVDGTYTLSNVTAATAGRLTGSAVPSAFDQPVVIDSSNAAVRVQLNGRESLRMDIPAGIYTTAQDFAAALDQAIAADPVMASFRLTSKTSWTTERFTMTSNTVGDGSGVTVLAMEPALAARLGLATAVSVPGTPAAGMINGVPATGSGTQLTAAPTSSARGLKITVLADIARASVTVTSGLGGILTSLATRVGGPEGVLSTSVQRLQRAQAALTVQDASLDAKSTILRERLTRQFSAMDTAVASFKSTQSFLQQQIDSWTKK